MVSVNFNIAQGQTGDGQFPQSIIVSSSTDTTPHLLKLKATQQGGTEARVSGFNLDTTNAVGAQANSQLLIMVTDSSVRVIEAKVRTASGQVIDLVPTTSQQTTGGAFSLANLPGGVYTLDVITQKGNAKAAYEGVLSIGQQPLTIIEETTKRVTNEYWVFPPLSVCPEGTTGTPPNCEPIPPPPNCDVDNPPPECAPTECPDGRIMPPGVPCPDDALPCDDDNLDRPCTVPTECPDGTIIPPGQECPEEDPPEEDPPEEDPPEEDPPEEDPPEEDPPEEDPPEEDPPEEDEEVAADEDADGAN